MLEQTYKSLSGELAVRLKQYTEEPLSEEKERIFQKHLRRNDEGTSIKRPVIQVASQLDKRNVVIEKLDNLVGIGCINAEDACAEINKSGLSLNPEDIKRLANQNGFVCYGEIITKAEIVRTQNTWIISSIKPSDVLEELPGNLYRVPIKGLLDIYRNFKNGDRILDERIQTELDRCFPKEERIQESIIQDVLLEFYKK